VPSWFQHVTGSLFLHQDLVFLHHQVWLDALQQCSTRVVVFPCVDAFLLFWVDVVLLTTLEGFVLLLCACVATTACEAPPKTSAVLSPRALPYHTTRFRSRLAFLRTSAVFARCVVEGCRRASACHNEFSRYCLPVCGCFVYFLDRRIDRSIDHTSRHDRKRSWPPLATTALPTSRPFSSLRLPTEA